MSFGATKLLSASGGKAYEINQSLMFDTGDTANLRMTPSSSGNRRTYTWSHWVKRSTLHASGYDVLWTVYQGSGNTDDVYQYLAFNDDFLEFSGYQTIWRKTNRKFRDVGAWYHIVVAVDTTQGTASNRIKIYVNGVQETSFATSNDPDENEDFPVNHTFQVTIGEHFSGGTSYPFDGYLAELQEIDGLQLAPSSFGETDSETNAWIPKKYVGSYGTNGFYLKFVSGAIGTDSSGNGHNFTTTDLANSDVMPDSPTNNFSTLNSLNNGSYSTLTQGNLRVNGNSTTDSAWAYGTILLFDGSGKWYFESRVEANHESGGSYPDVGFAVPDNLTNTTTKNNSTEEAIVRQEGTVRETGSTFTEQSGMDGTSFAIGDIFCLAIDMTNKKIWMGKNGTFFNSGNPVAGSNPTFTWSTAVNIVPATHNYAASQQTLNFGQNGTFCGAITAGGNADANGIGDFKYIPSGYKSICSSNLSTPTIKKSTEHFNPVLYTGSGSTRSITGVGHQPDWLWIKSRSGSDDHRLQDSVRGSTKYLESNTSDVEVTDASGITAFGSDGFTIGADSAYRFNVNTTTYVAWSWRAGGATPSKTYAVKVVSDSGNKYRFDDYGSSAVTLNLQEGGTYTFDQSDSSNATHPLRFSTTSDGSHGGGSEYTTGVTTNGTPGSSGAYTRITVAASAPTLYYYCTAHSGMGGQVNTNSTFGATNLDGSSLSIVSENTTSGFSVVSYTGTGANATVGHELGVAPSVIILKNRDTDDNWRVYSRNDATDYLGLNSTGASTDDNTTWNDTAPTSSVFTIGTDTNANRSGDDFIAYCFANVENFFKSGTYKGNGEAENGPVVTTSFSPALVIVKEASSAGGSWFMWDNKREVGNVKDAVLWADVANAETAHAEYEIDFLSNGFKIRGNSAGTNQNGETMLYMAWAESPFKYATAR